MILLYFFPPKSHFSQINSLYWADRKRMCEGALDTFCLFYSKLYRKSFCWTLPTPSYSSTTETDDYVPKMTSSTCWVWHSKDKLALTFRDSGRSLWHHILLVWMPCELHLLWMDSILDSIFHSSSPLGMTLIQDSYLGNLTPLGISN